MEATEVAPEVAVWVPTKEETAKPASRAELAEEAAAACDALANAL